VAPARRLLEGRSVRHVHIDWKEDVRVWHPGQTWIWQAGGLGVFDPGINALSIVTHILPERLHLTQATLNFPANCETPIAAELSLSGERGAAATMSLDFLHEGPPAWNIDVEHDGGSLRLSRGGAVLEVGDEAPVEAPDEEYPNLYRRFALLVNDQQSDVDVEPLRLVADAFLCGRRQIVDPFSEV
jgi:D-galactose 1-dehydrogenase